MSLFRAIANLPPPAEKPKPSGDEKREVFLKGNAVGESRDLRRVLALPRRERPSPERIREMAAALKAEFGITDAERGGPCECVTKYKRKCCKDLLDVQAWLLTEAREVGGILGPVGVGHGKTICDLLAAMVVPGCRTAVLLLPPNLKQQLLDVDWHFYGQHWRLPNLAGGKWLAPDPRPTIHVVAFSELSGSRSTDLLHRLRPDVVVVDEAHSVRNRTAARTKRFLRYFSDHEGVKLFAWSGTLTSKSLKDYCVDEGTRILKSDLNWIRAGDVKPGDELIGFDEGLGRKCKLRRSEVLKVGRVLKPRVRVVTDRGSVICSDTHQWVSCYKMRSWVETKDLKIGDEIAAYVKPWEQDTSRDGGYIAGLLDGEGWVASNGQVGFGQKPGVVMDNFLSALDLRGIKYRHSEHKSGVPRVIPNGENEHMRVLGIFRPDRLLQKGHLTWEGKQPWGRNTQRARVIALEALEPAEVVAIETTTHTFIAEGLLSHNSHLSNLALGEGSPTPLHWPTVEEWAGHLDPSEFRSPPGRLRVFGEDARAGFARRLVETSGVVSSGDSASCQASLVISERKVEAPKVVLDHLDALEGSWTRPDGEELVDAMSVGRCARELSCGFYYRWRWPRKEPTPVIERWLKARKEWHKELREKLKLSRPHMDSPLLCAKAAIRWYKGYTHVERDEEGREVVRHQIPPRTTGGPLPIWPSLCWPEWEEVRDTAQPETEAIWLDEYLVEDCLAWLQEGPGLLWYEFDGLARRLAQRARERDLRVVHCGPGADGNARVLALDGSESVITSIRAHGTGKNLQQFARNLVANWPSSGSECEQLIGRTHRQGQAADEVSFETYRHTEPVRKAIDKSRDLSSYIEETFGASQRLASKATWRF